MVHPIVRYFGRDHYTISELLETEWKSLMDCVVNCDLDCDFQLDDWVICGVNSLLTFEDR